jgi:hypothetical protein
MTPGFSREVNRQSRKTPDQLKTEIAYFARELQRTTSVDRQRRAHVAIRVREAALTVALQVRAGR